MSSTLIVSSALCLIDFLELVVEGHRFDIFEEIGCIPNTYNVTLAYPLAVVWNPVLSIITAIYGGASTSYVLSPEFRSSLQSSPHNTAILEKLSTTQRNTRLGQESQP